MSIVSSCVKSLQNSRHGFGCVLQAVLEHSDVEANHEAAVRWLEARFACTRRSPGLMHELRDLADILQIFCSSSLVLLPSGWVVPP